MRVRLLVQGAPGTTLTLLSNHGLLARSASARASWQVPAAGLRYLRAEVRLPSGELRAFTNPIWVRPGR